MPRPIHTNVAYCEILPAVTKELDDEREWYFVAKGANHEIMCHGEGHPSKENALRAAVGCFSWKTPMYDGPRSADDVKVWKPQVLHRIWNEINDDDEDDI